MEAPQSRAYMVNSCKEAVHSRDPVTYRPTVDQLHGRNIGRNRQGGVLREEYTGRSTQGGALKDDYLGEHLEEEDSRRSTQREALE